MERDLDEDRQEMDREYRDLQEEKYWEGADEE